MQIKQLEYLVKIVENGSISKAAEQLYISQPNLTKAISNLEKEYGIRLFNRKARGVELTAEGKEFMRYARKVIAEADALDSNFMQQKK
ncbi:MAG: LysR family transcriptional regulator [Lachnospiraceae bacterium]|nr:LysR family transcriptional regulator [Lachnospiraceae bacterium]